jgi:hypothetical protein
VYGHMGNSETRTGYGCELPAMVDLWRSVWHVQEGGGDPPIFGVATLAAGGSEGNGQHMGGMRWSQTANYGTLPNTAMRDSFLAQVYDLGDPWAAMGDGNSNMDANHCALPDPATGKYGTSQSFFEVFVVSYAYSFSLSLFSRVLYPVVEIESEVRTSPSLLPAHLPFSSPRVTRFRLSLLPVSRVRPSLRGPRSPLARYQLFHLGPFHMAPLAPPPRRKHTRQRTVGYPRQ